VHQAVGEDYLDYLSLEAARQKGKPATKPYYKCETPRLTDWQSGSHRPKQARRAGSGAVRTKEPRYSATAGGSGSQHATGGTTSIPCTTGIPFSRTRTVPITLPDLPVASGDTHYPLDRQVPRSFAGSRLSNTGPSDPASFI